jgi:hypothetical protein
MDVFDENKDVDKSADELDDLNAEDDASDDAAVDGELTIVSDLLGSSFIPTSCSCMEKTGPHSCDTRVLTCAMTFAWPS